MNATASWNLAVDLGRLAGYHTGPYPFYMSLHDDYPYPYLCLCKSHWNVDRHDANNLAHLCHDDRLSYPDTGAALAKETCYTMRGTAYVAYNLEMVTAKANDEPCSTFRT